MAYDCDLCDDTGWICDYHDTRPWVGGKRACNCDGPGIPCPECNANSDATRMPPGVTIVDDLAFIENQIMDLAFH